MSGQKMERLADFAKIVLAVYLLAMGVIILPAAVMKILLLARGMVDPEILHDIAGRATWQSGVALIGLLAGVWLLRRFRHQKA